MNYFVTGFSGTGSSAIIDFLLEFEDSEIAIRKDYEHYVFNYPNGLFDLESKLLSENDPLRSDEALYSFRKTMEFLYKNNFGWFGSYKKYLGEDFMKIVDELIEDLASPLNGTWYWRFQGVKKSPLKLFLHTMSELFLKRTHTQKGLVNKIDSSTIYYSIPTEEEFDRAARKFVSGFLSLCQVDDKNMVYDDLLWPSNYSKLNRYFSESKLIIVYRDPRDIFFTNKYYWSKVEASCCYPLDATEFCEYWKRSVVNYEDLDENTYIINFEDLVYDYENTANKLINDLGLDESTRDKFSKFDPKRSISNTQFYQSLTSSEEIEMELSIIESNLKDQLYDFPKNSDIDYGKRFL